jgi:hypothetical protein
MKIKPFTFLASGFLAVIAMLHILRVILGWEIVINGWHVPSWVNVVLAVVTATLFFMLWKETRPSARIMQKEMKQGRGPSSN